MRHSPANKPLTNDQEVNLPVKKLTSDLLFWVGVIRRYSNRSDLLQQLEKVSVILSSAGAPAKPLGRVEVSEGSRSRWLRDRFSAGELQAMIDLYRSGVPARVVAERYGVGVRSIKRLLHSRGVRRRDAR